MAVLNGKVKNPLLFPIHIFLFHQEQRRCSNFVDIFQNNQHIITNSYHAAYWGLLSGHNVTLLGYSSKFTSLLKIFNLDDNLLIKIQIPWLK